MFAADKNPGRSGARVCLVGAVLVLVMPMQEVGVAGLFVGGVDGHLRGTRPLQIEDAVATDQAWHRISPTTAQNVPTEDRPPQGKCLWSRSRRQRPAGDARDARALRWTGLNERVNFTKVLRTGGT